MSKEVEVQLKQSPEWFKGGKLLALSEDGKTAYIRPNDVAISTVRLKPFEGLIEEAQILVDIKNQLRCSFCGKHQMDVRKMIAGPQVYICNECVLICVEIIFKG